MVTKNEMIPFTSRMESWVEPKIKESICLFCSLGCGVAFRLDGQQVKELDYAKDNPVCNGSLCPRGHYNIELVNSPRRISAPRIGKRAAEWGEALSFLRERLKEFRPEEIGIVIAGAASSEDAFMAAKLAKTLGTNNLCAAGEPADLEAYQGSKIEVPGTELARVKEIDNSEALLIIGDLLVRSPVLSQRVNKVKYGKRSNKIIVVDPNKTHTAWFATNHLKNKPGTEAAVLAALAKILADENQKGDFNFDVARAAGICGLSVAELTAAAKDFNALPGTVIFVPGANKQRNDLANYLARLLAAVSPNKKSITFYSYGNTLGVNGVLDGAAAGHISYPELLAKVGRSEIKAMFMLGEDISPDLTGKFSQHLKFTLKTLYFPDETAFETEVQLPLASQFEAGGSFMLADGRIEDLPPLTSPAGARSIAEICSIITNSEFDRAKVKAETSALLAKKHAGPKFDLNEALMIAPVPERPSENITHFGNNQLAKNFYWYRLKGKGELE